MRNASRRVSLDAGPIEWMDIHLPASQPVSNATIHSNAIDCTIREEFFFLQDAVHEKPCCAAQRRPAVEKRKAPHRRGFLFPADARPIRTEVATFF
ncbi:hypothetical protein ERT44_12835 [Stenotrophomonas sp. MA5]|jgi:hypothetical protein|uniref:hypothetical protein n=1 Tax=Stenotrophomonas sp. MA5 TaxID=2508572 RepID=UPI001009FA34|nr:hypothetical protein [Stenotrophomonas sp. MA5]RXK65659.1 hypothetical protein ERT44_12835 [Stenotrophomonas sp. MA5]